MSFTNGDNIISYIYIIIYMIKGYVQKVFKHYHIVIYACLIFMKWILYVFRFINKLKSRNLKTIIVTFPDV